MELKIFEKFSPSLNVELPFAESMDGYLDEIIPAVRPWGEDLREEHFYLDKPWLEVSDDESIHASMLHYFNEGGEYLKSTDGTVASGEWRYLPGNKFMVGSKISGDNLFDGADYELYDLAFLDGQFFILKKHGDQQRLGNPKYLVMVYEPLGSELEWRDVVELLFNRYRNNNSFYVLIGAIILVIIAIIIVLS